MIEVSYNRLGLLRSKRTFFSDKLPSTQGFHFVICHSYLDLPCFSPFVGQPRSTSMIDLGQKSDAIFAKIHKKRRNIIKFGSKIDFKFTIMRPTTEILKRYQKLHNQFQASKAGWLLNLDFFKCASDHLTTFIAEYRDEIVIIMVVINDENTALNLNIVRNKNVSCPKEAYYAGSVLQWKSFLYYQKLGLSQFDMGGFVKPETQDSAVDWYKISYGGVTIPTFTFDAALTSFARVTYHVKKSINELKKSFNEILKYN